MPSDNATKSSEADNANQSISSQDILEKDKASRPFSTAKSYWERYYLKPVLAKFMRLDKACLSEVMKRFWSYILKA